MTKQHSSKEFFQSIDQLISANEQSNDPEVRKAVWKLKQLQRRTWSLRNCITAVQLTYWADKLWELLDDWLSG